MRFHRAESAFFILIALVIGAGVSLAAAVRVMRTNAHAIPEDLDQFQRLLLATGILLSIAIICGIFLIYPLIRTQVQEMGKLRSMAEKLSARSQSLEYAAFTDSLTLTFNRRYFDDAMNEYLKEFGRIQRPVGLMILDLDHFKRINDAHGHDIGDEVLRQLARNLKKLTRPHDVLARLGGEEFAFLIPGVEREELMAFGDYVRRAIEAATLGAGELQLQISVSVGLAIWDKRESAEEFYRRADRMLYKAKREGRNRVCG